VGIVGSDTRWEETTTGFRVAWLDTNGTLTFNRWLVRGIENLYAPNGLYDPYETTVTYDGEHVVLAYESPSTEDITVARFAVEPASSRTAAKTPTSPTPTMTPTGETAPVLGLVSVIFFLFLLLVLWIWPPARDCPSREHLQHKARYICERSPDNKEKGR